MPKGERVSVPHVTSCCCCFSLEVGAKITAFLHLILAIVMLVICSMFALELGPYVGTVEDAEDRLYFWWYVLAISNSLIAVGHVVLALTLIVSVHRRYARGLRFWVRVMAALYCLSLVVIVVVSIACGLSSSGSDIFISFLEGVLFYAVMGYLILVVNSYRMLLQSAEELPAAASTEMNSLCCK